MGRGVDAVGGVLRVLVLSVLGTFSGSSLYCGTGAAVIVVVVVLFFPSHFGLFSFWADLCTFHGVVCSHSVITH